MTNEIVASFMIIGIGFLVIALIKDTKLETKERV